MCPSAACGTQPMCGRFALPGWAERQGPRYSIVHLHPSHECEHVVSLVCRWRLHRFAEGVGHPFKGEAEFVVANELVDLRDVFALESVVQADHEATQVPGISS